MANLKRRLSLAASAAVVTAALAQPVWAQTAAQNTPPPTGQAQLEEIVVTAQGREQRLLDVPISVSVVNETAMANTGATDLRQVSQITPSLTLYSTTSEANASARVRGVGTVGDNPGLESSVAIFVDGVYRSRAGVGFGELGALDSVEVLRGPQGTLFGRNASAGLINITSKRPSFEKELTAEVVAGNYDYRRVAIGATGPIAEGLAGRIDAIYVRRDGFYHDVINDTDLNNRNRYFLRGQLLWEPVDDVRVRLIADYTQRDERCCGGVFPTDNYNSLNRNLYNPALNPIVAILQGLGAPARSFTQNPFDRDVYITAGRSLDGDTRDGGVSAQLDWTPSWGALTSVTAYRDHSSDQGFDSDLSAVDILGRTAGDDAYARTFKTFSQEFRLRGEALDGRLDWLVGAYYAHERLGLTENGKAGAQAGRFAACRAATLFGLNSLVSTGSRGCIAPAAQAALISANAFGAATPLILQGINNLEGLSGTGANPDRYKQKSENWALFTHNIWHVNDKLDLTVGLRYTHETKNFRAAFLNTNTVCPTQQRLLSPLLTTGAASLAGGVIALSCGANSTAELDGVSLRDRISESEVTGTAAVSYKPTEDLMVYASYSHGYKAGGFNLDRASLKSSVPSFASLGGAQALVKNLRFAPETVDAYEAGAKYSGRRASLSLTLFRAQYSDFQLNTFTGTTFIVQNIDGCTVDLNGGDRDLSATTGACPRDKVSYGVLSQGVEAEANVRPTRNLNLNLGVTYAETTFRKHLVGSRDGIPLDPALRLLPDSALSNSPKWVSTASISWTPPIGDQGLSALVYIDGRHTSGYNTGSDLTPQKVQEGGFVANARLGLRGPDQRWAVELWAQNLFDRDYAQILISTPQLAGASNLPAFPAATYPFGTQLFTAFLAEPRTYGVTLRGKF